MNSTTRGNAFEVEVFEFFREKISTDDFYFKRESCKVFRKKSYFSRDRQAEIEFDVVVEVYMPEQDKPSILFIVECKNYSHAVPVNDAEEFFQKTQQISGANIKAVIASPGTFQSGTVTFSQSKGMALMQYLGARNAKWHLSRQARGWTTPKTYNRVSMLIILQQGSDQNDYDEVRALVDDQGVSTINRLVHCLVSTVPLSSADRMLMVSDSKRKSLQRLPYRSRTDIERMTWSTLSDANYSADAVPIEVICGNLRETHGLVVDRQAVRPRELHADLLGRIFFDPPRITTFRGSGGDYRRERFTLAHEIGHLLLGHGDFLTHDSVDQTDGLDGVATSTGSMLIDRMEWQANHFAACLLMPKAVFESTFF